ncbi:hypothetical protein [Stenotrophomonas lactitubi]|uniref:hypothetical protein n=1 Tax=Stenotrophomonas lactitubi TaxID=2045214 RepID=UPI00333FA6B5
MAALHRPLCRWAEQGEAALLQQHVAKAVEACTQRPSILDGALARDVDTSAVIGRGGLEMGSTETTRAPRILRVEVMPLDCGETAVVVELASPPGRAWEKALKRVICETEGLESAQSRCDGRFVYIIGIEPGGSGTIHRVSQVLAATHERVAPRNGQPVPMRQQSAGGRVNASL